MSELTIRSRSDADLGALEAILARQQAQTQYPFVWPLSIPAERFIHRPTELSSWVAVLDGAVVGHVALQQVADDDLGRMWARAHRVPVQRLRCVGTLFADLRHAGRGVGSALLRTATDCALAEGGAPVLDVVAEHEAPRRLYRKHGWKDVGRYRPEWLPGDFEPVYVMILPLPQEQPGYDATAR